MAVEVVMPAFGLTDKSGRTIQAHPTLFEAISEAALDAARKAIHLPKK